MTSSISAVSQQASLDQSRGSLNSYYEASSVSSKDSGSGGYQQAAVISRQESLPVITNTSPGPALVAQALSGQFTADTIDMGRQEGVDQTFNTSQALQNCVV